MAPARAGAVFLWGLVLQRLRASDRAQEGQCPRSKLGVFLGSPPSALCECLRIELRRGQLRSASSKSFGEALSRFRYPC